MTKETPEIAATLELELKIKRAVKAKELFLKRFQDDACYALEWSQEVFEDAANEFVFKFVIKIVNKEGLKAAVDLCQREAIRAATWPQRSTSQPSNEIARCKGQAWASAYELLSNLKVEAVA